MVNCKALVTFFVILILNICTGVFAHAVPQYEIDFIKGDISQKIISLKESSGYNDCSLAMKAINFAFGSRNSIGDDSDINALMSAAVKILDLNTVPSQKVPEVSSELGNIFKTFTDKEIQSAVVEKMNLFPSDNNLSLVNAYLSEKIQKYAAIPEKSDMDEVTKSCIRFLKSHGNKTSFNLLFMADFMGIWQENKSFLEDAFGPLANNSGNEILSMFSSAKNSEKRKILQILSNNEIISIKIKGAVAEKALSDVITYMGGKSLIALSKDEVDVQILMIQLIADTKWTKSAKNATAYFDIARKEYESGYITDNEFSQIISNIASVACSSTGQVLSTYLDFLNKSMEKSDSPSEAVVLSVIKALGGLGDKTAFDYLLYVTYLNYPQYITNAARNALAQLKW
ncbi:MAG: hypothetical protein K6G00_13155 [Treponema sp.]|nr:hypothetical protein [Treponema sp.]